MVPRTEEGPGRDDAEPRSPTHRAGAMSQRHGYSTSSSSKNDIIEIIVLPIDRECSMREHKYL